ncbi:hypothetical protein EV363DRAFT_1273730 [Boletus edulis]|nr:hypothetical protein EV363DRAFT_1285711 [Boletus edulis]KAF8122838.1 hypothetical protein EV363DRAFT_1273730 [Boletus edulis]
MANLIRSAKSGNDWTQDDLQAYNIRVVFQDATSFFGGPLPQPTVNSEVLSARNRDDPTCDDSVPSFIHLLKLATSATTRDESAVRDFTRLLLEQLKYKVRQSDIVGLFGKRRYFEFITCGQVKHVEIDVFILDRSSGHYSLLVQEDRRLFQEDELDPEPQLVASAIGAFYRYNYFRVRALGLPALEEQMLPGIIMTGSLPTFYKISMTTALAHAVQDGQYPTQETVVYAHLPALPRAQQCFDEGMEPLDNRYIIFSCFEAFKQFVRNV